MDARITKKRLNILLSYDWIKIILAAVAAILVWSLLFTMTATRVTEAQNFTIFNYTGTRTSSRFSGYSDSLKEKGVFSYDVLTVAATDITSSDQYSSTILETRISTGEGDALFAANIPDESKKEAITDADGNKITPTYLEEFLYSYYSCAETFGEGGYLEEMKAYLNGYYGGDYTTNALDQSKAETDFRARIKSLKDKRFKSESKIKEGVKEEFARIEGYKKALINFEKYLDEGYISLQESTLYFSEDGKTVIPKKGIYSVNLCPDKRMENLKRDVFYTKSVADENGGTQTVSAAENLCIVLLNLSSAKYSYTRWEGLSFINYLVETHCAALNSNS